VRANRQQVLAAKRGSIIAAINEVEAAHAEDMWLAAYEADDQRYKVRGVRAAANAALLQSWLRAWIVPAPQRRQPPWRLLICRAETPTSACSAPSAPASCASACPA
jgi:hypothetical protein